jgi:hypothetical protein
LTVLREIFRIGSYPLVGWISKLLRRELRVCTLEGPRGRHPSRHKAIRLRREREATLILQEILEWLLLLLLGVLVELIVVLLTIPVIPSSPTRSSSPVSSTTATVSHDQLLHL